jgi:predicted nucleic acid-binding protein
VDKDLHASGIREFKKSRNRRISLVDHISFLVMKRRDITAAFAFDPDFKTQGFELFGE